MSQTPSDSPSPSPSKHANSSVGSAFKSKIAAFESGAAANASKRDQSKHIPHADLSNLRSRFDNKGEKPLEVKGSFGLGAAPAAGGAGTGSRLGGSGKDGHRAVSLGIGRAVSPMQSPSVVLPGSGPSLTSGVRSASSTTLNSTGSGNSEARLPPTSSTSRPHIPRSDSMNSNSTSATSTSISGATAASTNSSLLPGPLAALRASGSTPHANSPYGGDDSTSTGLRTPMSSISLSSLQVETGSTAGDIASSSGDTTANEDDGTTDTLPQGDDVPNTPQGETTDVIQKESPEDIQDDSASLPATTATDDQRPPQEAVERAAEELDKYALEESSKTAVISPTSEDTPLPPSISLSQLASPLPDADDAANSSEAATKLPSPPSSSARKSLSRTSSSAFSPKDRLKRSSTANSIASHPESDLADTNLESFDQQDDSTRAKRLADIVAPSPGSGGRSSGEPPSTPSRTRTNATPTSGKTSPLDKLLAEEQDFLPVDAAEDQDEVDEEGMPLVKCSDCGAKVSLVKLGEHVCPASTPAASKIGFPTSPRADALNASPTGSSFRDRRETGPEDVPKGALSPEIVDSPNMSHRSITSSRPDVPDDEALSVASIDGRLEDTHLDDPQSSPDSKSAPMFRLTVKKSKKTT
ncbi:hypothetical protein P389DRAFT_80529 [Cystobasidium minutum MCA 4210]|uniref:uncharacterized protein n=1 Tax=Cystobasidium minutum MCA 4210 TaxID=1397322 RepID=UPI0034CDC6CE|eukprot:jgi/Rhomi1/80529/CE80528_226